MKNKKSAQIWFLDFVVGISIFMIVVMIYYNYYDNLSEESEATMNEMLIDAKSISSMLITEGNPKNWTEDDVEIIGITNGNYRLNDTKMQLFSKMSEDNYEETKRKLNTRFEYYFFIEDKNGTRQFYAGSLPTNNKYLVQTTRVAIYNSTINKLVIYLWQ